jgi:hypothetical protein
MEKATGTATPLSAKTRPYGISRDGQLWVEAV